MIDPKNCGWNTNYDQLCGLNLVPKHCWGGSSSTVKTLSARCLLVIHRCMIIEQVQEQRSQIGPNSSISFNANRFGGSWCCLCFYQMEFARFEDHIGCLFKVVFAYGPKTRAAFYIFWTWGWGGVKFLHIERKTTSVVHSHPPSHYIRKHTLGWLLVMFTTHRMQNGALRIAMRMCQNSVQKM